MGMRTINLKLYNPGKRKRQLIDKAMLNYSRAYQYLLDKASGEIDEIEGKFCDQRGEYRAVNVGRWIDKEIARELNQFDIEPFKDSLKIDFSMTLASYLTLRKIQNEVSYPMAYVSDQKWESCSSIALNDCMSGKKSCGEYMKEIRKLSHKNETYKPVFFCRYAQNRDYCLLYDSVDDRYYVKLYLMNVKSSLRSELNTDNGKELFYIHKDKRLLDKRNKKERFIIVPLAFGKWQEQYLKKALENPEILKTARLVKKNDEYYISINIDIGETEKAKAQNYLGLARGLKNTVHYTVVDLKGETVKCGLLNAETKADNKGLLPENSIHAIANKITATAREYNAQVIMQAFINKGDRLQWISSDNEKYTPVLNYHSYNNILTVLEYKLDGKGLKPPVKVSPVGVFYTCPDCGLHSVKNRFSRDMFICIECGKTMDIEALGSLNVARKLINYSEGLLKVKVETTSSGVRFICRDLGLSFSPVDPFNSLEEFTGEVKSVIKDFYDNMNKLPRDKAFKKKYSLIKKIEEERDLTKLIELV